MSVDTFPTSGPDDIQQQVYQYFLLEAPELIQSMEQDLLELLREHSVERVHSLMRNAHTLKGAAASVERHTLRTLAHHLEDVFKALYEPERMNPPELGSLLMDGFDSLRFALQAELAGTPIDEEELLNRTAGIFAQLQHHLGDAYGQDEVLPSSADLGFDVVGSLFEESVLGDLHQLAYVLSTGDPEPIRDSFIHQSEFFAGLAESYNLPGLGMIASATIAALHTHPEQTLIIAELALEDYQNARLAILAGDRDRGGDPSPLLLELAGQPSMPEPMGDRNPIAADPVPTNGIPTEYPWPDVAVDFDAPGEEAEPLPTPGSHPTASLESDPLPIPSAELPPLAQIEAVLQDIEAELQRDPLLVQPKTDALERTGDSVLQGSPEQPGSVLDGLDVTPTTPPAPKPTPQRPANPGSGSRESMSKIRVDLKHLEQLNHAIGELLIDHNQQTQTHQHTQRELQETLLLWQQAQEHLDKLQDWAMTQVQPTPSRRPSRKTTQSKPTPNPKSFDSLELDAYSELHVLVQAINESFGQMEDRLRGLQGQHTGFELKRRKRLLDQAQEEVLRMRMVPVGTVLQRFSPVLEQLQAAHNSPSRAEHEHKPIQLTLRGTELLVDKSLVEKLYDPLLHLVRNAFDHGIEPQAERLAQGKPAIGQITIAAFRQGNRTVIEVRDDGQGLNWERIRQKGIQRGLLSPEAQPSLEQLKDLLFEPGFSTAAQVNQLSGRGVGLDVVRSQLQALQGSIAIHSQPGAGTTFSLYLPLTLSTERLLVCQCGGIPYALLTDAIVQIVSPNPVDGTEDSPVQHYQGFAGEQRAWRWEDGDQTRWLPIRSLSETLSNGMEPPTPTTGSPTAQKALLILLGSIAADGERVPVLALEVDQILAEQDLVVKPLRPRPTPP
ncbi:MAG: ATP-binding protein, partial [Cyanobacteriota bacterium]